MQSSNECPPAEKAASQELLAGSSVCPLCDSHQVSKFMLAPDRFHMRTELYTLMRCATCSCVWVANPPSPEELRRAVNYIRQHWQRRYGLVQVG